MENKHKKTSASQSSKVSATGGIEVKNDKARGTKTAGFINFYENSNAGKNKILFKAPESLDSDYTLTLPNTIGESNQVLRINSINNQNLTSVWGASGNTGASIYNSVSLMTSATTNDGDIGLVKNDSPTNDKLYIKVDNSWFFISEVTNATPIFTSVASTGNVGGSITWTNFNAAQEFRLNANGTPTVITLTATDTDGHALTYDFVTVPQYNEGSEPSGVESIVVNANVITVTPKTTVASANFELHFNTTDGIVVETIGDASSAKSTFVMTNSPPTWDSIATTGYKTGIATWSNPSSGSAQDYTLKADGTAMVMTLNATDPESGALTYSFITDPAYVNSTSIDGIESIVLSGNELTITPKTKIDATLKTFDLTLTVTDIASQAVNANSSVSTISLQNTAPDWTSVSVTYTDSGAAAVSWNGDGTHTFKVNTDGDEMVMTLAATDPDSVHTIAYSFNATGNANILQGSGATLNDKITHDTNNNTLTFTPSITESHVGDFTLDLTATEEWTGSGSHAFTKISPTISLAFILYSMTFPFAFTTSLYGRDGPTLAQCKEVYPSWADSTSNFNVEGEWHGIQIWTVPVSGSYIIDVYGAQGGFHSYDNSYGGLGARIQATYNLTQGDKYKLIVGQQGESAINLDNAASGGGGGSFIWAETGNTLLIAAGGGGGGIRTGYVNSHATISSNAKPAESISNGGTNGNGGTTNTTGSSYWAGGGCGWLTNGTGGNQSTNYDYTPGDSGAEGGRRPLEGGRGGNEWYDSSVQEGGKGGFGGGGGGGSDNMGTGGGGGYSGGGGGRMIPYGGGMGGGGGGSWYNSSISYYQSSPSPVEQDAYNTSGYDISGHGKIIITLI